MHGQRTQVFVILIGANFANTHTGCGCGSRSHGHGTWIYSVGNPGYTDPVYYNTNYNYNIQYTNGLDHQHFLVVPVGYHIRLYIYHFATESCCDKLYVSWGGCYGESTNVAIYSGTSLNTPVCSIEKLSQEKGNRVYTLFPLTKKSFIFFPAVLPLSPSWL